MVKLTRTYGLVALLCLVALGAVAAPAGAQGTSDAFATLQTEIQNVALLHGQNIGVYVETDEGVIAINEANVMSSASIIKVPILVEAIKQAEQGELFWDDEILVTADDVVTGSGTIRDMDDLPKTFTVRELAELMILVSDNTATNIFMEIIGFDEMNRACIEMGCVDTLLQNSIFQTMPQDRGPRNWATAKDMVLIVKGANEGFLTEAGRAEFLRIMEQANNVRLSEYWDEELHGDIKVGRKGGSTASPRVLHDVGLFTMGDKVVYAAVLTGDVEPDVARPAIGDIGASIMKYMLETK